jgi:hypothetical protein
MCSKFRLRNFAEMEVREYAPYLIAEATIVGQPMRRAQGKGFMQVAKFIFGDNVKAAATVAADAPPTPAAAAENDKVAMTSPVRMTLPSEKVNMTAPVRMQVPAAATPGPSEQITMAAPVQVCVPSCLCFVSVQCPSNSGTKDLALVIAHQLGLETAVVSSMDV